MYLSLFLQFSLQILPLLSANIADKIVFPHRTLMGGAWLNISLKLRHFVESDKLIFPVSCDKNQMVGLKFPQRYFPLVSLRCCNGVFWWGAGMKISPHLYVLGTNSVRINPGKKCKLPNKKVKDYKSLLLKRSTFFEEKDQMRSNSEEICRLLGKNAKKITIYLSHYLTLFSPLWCTTPWNAISDLIERWKICVLCKMHRPCL